MPRSDTRADISNATAAIDALVIDALLTLWEEAALDISYGPSEERLLRFTAREVAQIVNRDADEPVLNAWSVGRSLTRIGIRAYRGSDRTRTRTRVVFERQIDRLREMSERHCDRSNR